MRGKTSKSLPLTVNPRIHRLLLKEFKKDKIPKRLHRRLQIILEGISGKSIYQSSRDLGCKEKTVRLWRTRWTEEIEDLLNAAEVGIGSQELKDYELLNLIKELLSDKQRSGSPKQISIAQEEQIRALACTSPLDHGIQMTRWTHEMLAHVAKSNKIVDEISSRYIGTILKKTR